MMKSLAFQDFVVGVGLLLMLEGLLFAAIPGRMRKAMKSVLASPDNLLRAVGLSSAVIGLILVWLVRH